MKPGTAVWFNDGQGDTLALVAHKHSAKMLDLIVFDRGGGNSSKHTSVPRRDPKDYGDEGGGRTWHPLG